MFTRRSFLQAGLVALAGCKMSRYLEIDENGVARPGGPKGRIVHSPKPVILNLPKSARGMIGRTVTVGPGEVHNILDWQTDDDENALPVTIVVGIPNSPILSDPNVQSTKVQIRIKYGIGGSQNEMLVDAVPGNIVTLPATYIRVDAVSDPDIVNAAPVDVSAFLCRFSVSHPPTKVTLGNANSTVIPAGNSLRLPIPTLTRSFRVYNWWGVVLPNVPWSVTLTNSTGVGTLLTFDYPGGTVMSDEIIVPNDCFFIRVFNGGPENLITCRAVFDLF